MVVVVDVVVVVECPGGEFHAKPVDLWALGITMHAMLCGEGDWLLTWCHALVVTCIVVPFVVAGRLPFSNPVMTELFEEIQTKP
jgi:hypothetical protein